MSNVTRVGINGFGRIGKLCLRAAFELPEYRDRIQVVAINNPRRTSKQTAHDINYDTTHGRWGMRGRQAVGSADDEIVIGTNEIRYFSTYDPAETNWGDVGVDIVFECTGKFRCKQDTDIHLQMGAEKVLISSPAKGEVDATIVCGVNDKVLTESMTSVSNASCTTNALAPILKVLDDAFGVEKGLLTSIHAYTATQNLVDGKHSDLQRGRAAALNIVPSKTGAALAIGEVMPHLSGKLLGIAQRVPVANVSLLDLVVHLREDVTRDTVTDAMCSAALHELRGIMDVNTLPLVSGDFNHSQFSVVYNHRQTFALGNLVKVFAWYDNEWGYSCRMLDVALRMQGQR